MSGFATAAQAEKAFYSAFAEGDLVEMTRVWADDADIICIHPHGGRLQGREAVLGSWNEILSAMRGMMIRASDPIRFAQGRLAVHHVREQLFVDGQRRGVVLATNVYRQTSEGWRMILHHAVPDPSPPPALESVGVH